MSDSSGRQADAPRLSRPSSHSWVEVDLGAIRHNVRVVKKLLGPRCHLWAVVKADAYGHGAGEVAQAALAAGADGLAVSCLNEASELRVEAKTAAPLLVLAPGEARAAAWIVRLDIVQTACVAEVVESLSRAAQRLGKPARVHLKVDTGMGRLGVAPEEVMEFARFASGLPGIALEGVFSHLATAEAEDDAYARLQFERFEAAAAELTSCGIDCGMRHIANSAAALRFPEMRLDGVRAGLLIYGIDPGAPGEAAVELRPAMAWKTRLSFLHRVSKGATVSYGRTFVARRESVIGVLPVGYADGYPRGASNRAHVLLRGRPCPVVGVVCMDHMMIDATDVPEAEIDDEVILLGRQGKETISANQLATWAGTVVHEVPTVIGRRVKRVYCDREQPRDPGLVPEEPT
jgi:alanine racemase